MENNNGLSKEKIQEKQDLIKLSTLSIIILIILSLLYSGCSGTCENQVSSVSEDYASQKPEQLMNNAHSSSTNDVTCFSKM